MHIADEFLSTPQIHYWILLIDDQKEKDRLLEVVKNRQSALTEDPEYVKYVRKHKRS